MEKNSQLIQFKIEEFTRSQIIIVKNLVAKPS